MNQPLTDYLRNKEIIKNLRYIFSPVGFSGYELEPGVLVSEDIIKEMYPLGSKIMLWNSIHKGENPDGTRV